MTPIKFKSFNAIYEKMKLELVTFVVTDGNSQPKFVVESWADAETSHCVYRVMGHDHEVTYTGDGLANISDDLEIEMLGIIGGLCEGHPERVIEATPDYLEREGIWRGNTRL